MSATVFLALSVLRRKHACIYRNHVCAKKTVAWLHLFILHGPQFGENMRVFAEITYAPKNQLQICNCFFLEKRIFRKKHNTSLVNTNFDENMRVFSEIAYAPGIQLQICN